ncbi:hypothetical protein WR25_13426 [Diploscapter pachys]|uniref:Uncharacterized protein n=1 Tax=Diploscapter pachys TaxID=2018661 RepID=A0A2A2KGC5_9BILA|nr:hypothetical protein WR25_13426 [Diploscapter pachys]
MERGRSCAMHADEGWNRIEEIEENGLKGWNWDGDGKGMQQKQKDEEMQRRLLIAAKGNNHNYWYFFAMRSISVDGPTVPHVDSAPVHTHSGFCLPIHTQLEERRFESEGEKEDPKSKDRGAVRVQNASIRYLI